MGSDFFDVHAALGSDHDDRLFFRPVDRDRDVSFARDRDLFLDEQRLHDFAVGILHVAQGFTDQLACQFAALFGIIGKFDPAGFTATAHEHLTLEHPRARVCGNERRDVGGARCKCSARRRNADAAKQIFALILHKFHAQLPPQMPGAIARAQTSALLQRMAASTRDVTLRAEDVWPSNDVLIGAEAAE